MNNLKNRAPSTWHQCDGLVMPGSDRMAAISPASEKTASRQEPRCFVCTTHLRQPITVASEATRERRRELPLLLLSPAALIAMAQTSKARWWVISLSVRRLVVPLSADSSVVWPAVRCLPLPPSVSFSNREICRNKN